MEHEPPRTRSFVGTVVKTVLKDTATVRVDRYEMHPKYKKYRIRSRKFLAHDPGNVTSVGDKVTITETRPISKHKHFVITAHTSMAQKDEVE